MTTWYNDNSVNRLSFFVITSSNQPNFVEQNYLNRTKFSQLELLNAVNSSLRLRAFQIIPFKLNNTLYALITSKHEHNVKSGLIKRSLAIVNMDMNGLLNGLTENDLAVLTNSNAITVKQISKNNVTDNYVALDLKKIILM